MKENFIMLLFLITAQVLTHQIELPVTGLVAGRLFNNAIFVHIISAESLNLKLSMQRGTRSMSICLEFEKGGAT